MAETGPIVPGAILGVGLMVKDSLFTAYNCLPPSMTTEPEYNTKQSSENYSIQINSQQLPASRAKA